MATLSVFRRGEDVSQTDHSACLTGATTKADTRLITLVLRTGRPALIGLDGHNTIIKPAAEGDEFLSFDGLLDLAMNSHDLKVMQDRGVKTPDEVKPETYDVTLTVVLPHEPVEVHLQLKADSNLQVIPIFEALIKEDLYFRLALYEATVRAVSEANGPGDIVINSHRESRRVQMDDPNVLPDGLKWRVFDADAEVIGTGAEPTPAGS